MKKLISMICVLSLILMIFVSCSHLPQESNDETVDENPTYEDNDEIVSEDSTCEDNNEILGGNPVYNVLVYDYSDSIGSANHKIEYEFADHAKYDNVEPTRHIELSINGNQYNGAFQMTQYREYNYFPVYRYIASEGVVYEIDESNMLVSCFWGKSDSDVIMSENDCTKIAVAFMRDKIDLSQYNVSVTNNYDQQAYIIKFSKYFGDIKTTDEATVTVQYNGDLYSYSSFMLGKVSVDSAEDIGNVDINDVKASIYAKLDKIYANAKADYSRIDYSEPNLKITSLKDGSMAYVCYVDVECINVSGEFETVMSERINMVVKTD